MLQQVAGALAARARAPLSAYVHWPYCRKICPYCDFNRFPLSADTHGPRLRDAYEKELSALLGHDHSSRHENTSPAIEDSRGTSKEIPRESLGVYSRDESIETSLDDTHSTMYFGGGTPSLGPPLLFNALIGQVKEHCSRLMAPLAEVTMEANPTSIESARLGEFRHAGMNRVSIGVQSLRDDDLRYLGREHTARDAREALATATDVFGEKVSFDLIYGRHQDERVDEWAEELREGCAIGTNHMSCYSLTIEHGTPFHQRLYAPSHVQRIFLPDPEVSEALYWKTMDVTRSYGLEQYEISNFARSGYESAHNLRYWEGGDYIGVGPGAHSRVTMHDGTRVAWSNHRVVEKWMESVETEGVGMNNVEVLSRVDAATEIIMMGLRTRDGVSSAMIKPILGLDRSFHDVLDSAKMREYRQLGLIEETAMPSEPREDVVRCTTKGRAVLDTMLPKLIR